MAMENMKTEAEILPAMLIDSPYIWDLAKRKQLGAEWEKLRPHLTDTWAAKMPLIVNRGGYYRMCVPACAKIAKDYRSYCYLSAPCSSGGMVLRIEFGEWSRAAFYEVAGSLNPKTKRRLASWLRKAFPYPGILPTTVLTTDDGTRWTWADIFDVWQNYPEIAKWVREQFVAQGVERDKRAGLIPSAEAESESQYEYKRRFVETLKLYRRRGGLARQTADLLETFGTTSFCLRGRNTDELPYVILDSAHPFGEAKPFGVSESPHCLSPEMLPTFQDAS